MRLYDFLGSIRDSIAYYEKRTTRMPSHIIMTSKFYFDLANVLNDRYQIDMSDDLLVKKRLMGLLVIVTPVSENVNKEGYEIVGRAD